MGIPIYLDEANHSCKWQYQPVVGYASFLSDNVEATRPECVAVYFTLGNQNAHLGGKHNAPLLIHTWKIFILTDLTDIYVMESISSRI